MVLSFSGLITAGSLFKISPNDNEYLIFAGNRQITTENETSIIGNFNTGFKVPSTVVDDASVGTKIWSKDGASYVTALAAEDENYCYTSSPQVTHYLKCTNFGFSLPTDAVIIGIRVKIWRLDHSGTGTTLFDNSVRLVKNGVIWGDDKASIIPLPIVETYSYYGGTADLWGQTWTADEINADNFGIAYSGNRDLVYEDYFINSIQLEVYYSSASSGIVWEDTTDYITAVTGSTKLFKVHKTTGQMQIKGGLDTDTTL